MVTNVLEIYGKRSKNVGGADPQDDGREARL